MKRTAHHILGIACLTLFASCASSASSGGMRTTPYIPGDPALDRLPSTADSPVRDSLRLVTSWAQPIIGHTGAQLFVRNDRSVPVQITRITILVCENVLSGCAVWNPNFVLMPGVKKRVYTFLPDNNTMPWRFTWRVEGVPLPPKTPVRSQAPVRAAATGSPLDTIGASFDVTAASGGPTVFLPGLQYAKHHMRLSADLATTLVGFNASVWMRAEGRNGPLAMATSDSTRVSGTRTAHVEASMLVPEDAIGVTLGVKVVGGGDVAVSRFRLSEVPFAELPFAETQAMAMSIPHNVVIDTDAGPDDLMAIAFLLGRPELHIVGITIVKGVASVASGTESILRLLSLANAPDIPVYAGSSKPLLPTKPFPKAWMDAAASTGRSAAPATTRRAQTGDAATFLKNLLMKSDTSTEILALGPLTNLALAIRAAGASNVQPLRTVIMGGAVGVPGNLNAPEFKTTNTRAEWNFYSDPRAAQDVLASRLLMELVSLDVTKTVKFDTCFASNVARGEPWTRRNYVSKVLDGAHDWIVRGDYYAWDPLAAVILADPTVAQRRVMPVRVDLSQQYTGALTRTNDPGGVYVETSVDPERFARIFSAALGGKEMAGPYFCKR